MIHISLAGQAEAWAPREAALPGVPGRLLDHQWQTHRAAASPLVVNTSNTGTGKTRAALLRLLDLDPLDPLGANCLLIAPTNELVEQHARDVTTFVDAAGTGHQVLRLTREWTDSYDAPDFATRRGDRLVGLLKDPRHALGGDQRRPIVVVSNPDIFYYALYFRYNRHDRRPLFREFLAGFRYIVVDEFHYYNAKQLANFLFFLALSRDYGYFEHGRQVCLLSATPTREVRTYLERLGLSITWIPGAAGQPAEEGRETTPALAPVELTVIPLREAADGLPEVVRLDRTDILSRLDDGEHGAIISSALWRINQIYHDLSGLGDRVGRLTGAESRAGREAARVRDLLLATPTVDIGYNFERFGKDRQNIDFLYFDARSSDEVIQRLGRAGRVLGKQVTGRPSHVVAVVPDELADVLAQYDGRAMGRAELARLITEHLPPKHSLYAYVQRGAIAEAFLPIFHLGNMTATEEEQDLRNLFQGLADIYGARADSYGRMRRAINEFLKSEERWAKADPDGRQLGEQHLDGYLATNGLRLSRAALAAARREVADPSKKVYTEVRGWALREMENYYARKARFAFRDDFAPPQALVFDPNHALSSSDTARYDAFHIVQNFEAQWCLDRRDWARRTGLHAEDADVYCVLARQRAADERGRLALRLETSLALDDWEARYARTEAAARGFRLDVQPGPCPLELGEAFRHVYCVLFAVPVSTRLEGMLRALCWREGIVPRNLVVESVQGRDRSYLAVLGTSALLVAAELTPAVQRADREASRDAEPFML